MIIGSIPAASQLFSNEPTVIKSDQYLRTQKKMIGYECKFTLTYVASIGFSQPNHGIKNSGEQIKHWTWVPVNLWEEGWT